ncbi:MAG: hypothetical protein K9M56_04400 [Victivallales bacterium]|nr:hypothetical protein [Victivallales bacterium]
MKQIKINKAFRKALREAINEVGSQVGFEKKTGVSQKALSKILAEKTNSILDTTYEKIYPYIKKYLSKEEISTLNHAVNNHNSHIHQNVYNHNPDHISRKELIGKIMSSDTINSEEKLKFIKIANEI